MSFQRPFTEKLKDLGLSRLQERISNQTFINSVRNILQKENELITHKGIDKRIWRVIYFMSDNVESIIKAKEAAELCHLSESRFLHLFKKETGINFRKAQIWNRLVRAFTLLHTDKKLIEIAYLSGFTDNAHFNKKYRECFGLVPKTFKKNSHFIQFWRNSGM